MGSNGFVKHRSEAASAQRALYGFTSTRTGSIPQSNGSSSLASQHRQKPTI